MAKVSVIIPSRNEKFLPQTVKEVLTKSRGDLDLFVTLDGYWPDPPLPEDPRLHLIHKGKAQGMRPGINSAVSLSRSEFLLKLDGHCMLDEGFDLKLAAECDQDWVVIPRRHRLDADAWKIDDEGRLPIDYHYLSYPFERDEVTCGLHGAEWRERAKARKDILLDDEMSSQGSCWFMSRAHWDRVVGPLDVANYGTFVQEFQEIGCKTWLSGGRVKVNKKTWYAHLHKGTKHGRGYTISRNDHARGVEFTKRFWMLDGGFPHRKHALRWLIERFAPVPTWPKDLDEAFAKAREVYRD